jgi:hypothetical protein
MSVRQGLRVGFCGAGGTGKTTTAQFIAKELELPILESTSRTIYKAEKLTESIVANMGDESKLELQRKIFKAKVKNDTKYSYVADRTLLDHWCYCLAYCGEFMPDELFEKMEEQVRIHMKAVYSHIFYFPWGYWQPESDGVRSELMAWQSQIDAIMVGYIVRWNIPIIEVPQTQGVDYRNEFIRDQIIAPPQNARS